jgi:hypothetical protein
MNTTLPVHYARATRTIIRFAIVMAFLGLLSGVAYRESAKKLPDDLGAGMHIESLWHLALVHGHMLLIGTVLPIVMIAMLIFALKAGGRELGRGTLRWLTTAYPLFASISIALQLYKGYHWLLKVRGGELDIAAIDDAFFGGATVLRYIVYGAAHTLMGLAMAVFMIALWRSLRIKNA